MISLILLIIFNLNFTFAEPEICLNFLDQKNDLSESQANAYLINMKANSFNLSRTKYFHRNPIVPKEIWRIRIPFIAAKNFEVASLYILHNYNLLPLNLKTAIELNVLITQNLVPAKNIGLYNYRLFPEHINEAVPFNSDPKAFYNWLLSLEALRLFETNPIELAEIAHNTISALDSFPDGNGRLARLFADLILLKAGLAPAYYDNISEYFIRGNPRSFVSREERKAYFHEVVFKGQVFKSN